MDDSTTSEEAAHLRALFGAENRFEKLSARIAELGAAGWKRQELNDLLCLARIQGDEKIDEDILKVQDCLYGWVGLAQKVIETADSNGRWYQGRLTHITDVNTKNGCTMRQEAAQLRELLDAVNRVEKLAKRIAELGASGWKRQELYDLLESIRIGGDEKLDDDIMDVMDCLAGWVGNSSSVIKTADSNGRLYQGKLY